MMRAIMGDLRIEIRELKTEKYNFKYRSMIDLNYTEVPSTPEQDGNKGHSRWLGGKCVSVDEGSHVTFYLGHELREDARVESGENSELGTENSEVREVTMAFAVRVAKPVTRDAAINAAEMEAYGLSTPMQVASLAASMARKSRQNPQDEEVAEHDKFIEWVKTELTEIGV